MKAILIKQIRKEMPNSAGFGAFNQVLSSGGSMSEARKAASEAARGASEIGNMKDVSFTIRDTRISKEEFNSLSDSDKKEALSLRDQFKTLGYVDVRTQMGPSQWNRVSAKERKRIEDVALKTFRLEDRLKNLKKTPAQRKVEKRNELIQRMKNQYAQGRSLVNTMKDFKAVKSKRSNATKRAYLEALSKMNAAERALKRLGVNVS